jgi:predicted acetyltransferase
MPEITVRPATTDDLDTIAHLRSLGFGGDEAEVRTNLENNPRYNYRHIVMADIEGQSVGTACVFPTQMWLSGVPVEMGAVAGVTTHPNHRNKGVFAAMMRYLIDRMAHEELAISALFPASHAIYQKFGYAPAAIWQAYSIKPENLLLFTGANQVRPFEPTDLPTIRSIYRGGQLSRADGRLTRLTAWWDSLVSEKNRTGNNYIVVYDDEGVEGYLKYTITDEKVLKVREMLVYSDAAYRGLWSYMAAQPDVVSIDYIAPADEPVFHLLNIPGDSHGGNRGWIFDDIYHGTSTFMLRIVNVVEALTSRFYPQDMMGNRILKIYDPQIPANEKPIKFRLVDGRPETEPAEDQTPQIETDMVTFSQIFCGFLSPEKARGLGKLQTDDESVSWLSKAMKTRPLYIHHGDWF